MHIVRTNKDLNTRSFSLAIKPDETLDLTRLYELAKDCKALSWLNNDLSAEELDGLLTQTIAWRALNLSGSAHLTSSTLQLLLTRAPALRFLDVSFCPLDDDAFRGIKAPLVFLNLQGCSAITDATLRELAKSATLQHLLIAFNDQITPAGVQAFSARPLKTLKIHGCRNIESLVA